MDTKKLFEIYQTIWHHIKEHLQDIDNSSDESWWDEEGEASRKILESVKDEPKYVQRFTEKLLTAEWELLHEIYIEKGV